MDGVLELLQTALGNQLRAQLDDPAEEPELMRQWGELMAAALGLVSGLPRPTDDEWQVFCHRWWFDRSDVNHWLEVCRLLDPDQQRELVAA